MKESAEQHGLAAHRGAVADARARLLQLKIAEEERRLVDLGEAMDIVERGLRGYVAVLTMLPLRISAGHAARRLQEIAPSDHDERVRVTVFFDVARGELAAAFEACAKELKTGV